jgi:hypothetical protein
MIQSDNLKEVLWLEDQYLDLVAYLCPLFQAGYAVDTAESVSEAVKRLQTKEYYAAIFDLNVGAGDDVKWRALEHELREQEPYRDPHLGFWLLRAMYYPVTQPLLPKNVWPIEIEIVNKLPPTRIGVFTIVHDNIIWGEITESSKIGIPIKQVVRKQTGDLAILKKLVENMR